MPVRFTIVLYLTLMQFASANGNQPSAKSEILLTQTQKLLAENKVTKQSEKQLEQNVLAFASQEPAQGSKQLLAELSLREPKILVPHEEGNVLVPFVDVGAAARYVLRYWERQEARQFALRASAAADTRFLDKYFSSDANRQSGFIDAVNDAPEQDLLLYRDELLEKISLYGADRLAAAMAKSLGDAGLHRQVIRNGSAPVALATLPVLQENLGVVAALPLLQLALSRDDIASAAVFEIAQLGGTLPQANDLLWQLIADPEHGSSAAAAIARYADRHAVNKLSSLLSSPDSLLRNRASLALRLIDRRASLLPSGDAGN
ncbi:MAG: hypothetical protein HKM98_02585 [Gammaproteobacteria bacterium]|nr:hypothetical protein [Gammaproteobacteria bacterium]